MENNQEPNLQEIENNIKSNSVVILKFDNIDSKYNEFFDKLKDTSVTSVTSVTNITDKEIIDFYDIDVLPTIYVYKNKNLLGIIEGYYSKSILLKKINLLIE